MRTSLPLALLLLAATAACSSDPWDDPSIGDPYVPDPRTARRVGRLLEDAAPRLTEGAGGGSVHTGDRSIWLLTGATLGLGDDAYQLPSMVLSTEATDWPGSNGTRGWWDATRGLPEPPEGHGRRWLSGIAVSDQTDVFLLYSLSRLADGASTGYGVARGSADGMKQCTANGDWRFFGPDDPAFGMAVVQAGHGVTTGFDYVFGVRADEGRHNTYLARVPHGALDDRTAYRFFAGEGRWSEDVGDAEPLFRAGPQGLSVSWNAHLQAFLAVYAWIVPAKDGDGDRIRVLARAARDPDGPWSRETPLFETRGPVVPGRDRRGAGAHEHPQLTWDGGRVLFVTVDGGAESGAPRMWRVDLPETR